MHHYYTTVDLLLAITDVSLRINLTFNSINLQSGFIFICLLNHSLNLAGVNPLNPSINIHILDTVLHTFPMILMRRICLTIKTFLDLVIIFFTLVTFMFD